MSTLKANSLTNATGTRSIDVNRLTQATAIAWVCFNGQAVTGPFTIANGGIRSAYNVASITDSGVGLYTVNFSAALPDTNYCAVATCHLAGGVTWAARVAFNTPTTSGLPLGTTHGNVAFFDPLIVNVVIYR